MTNKEFVKLFKLTASLMELHEENPFKVRVYSGAVYAIEKLTYDIDSVPVEELEKIEGIGKNIASKIVQIKTTGTFPELEAFLANTPHGVVKMLGIKGIGPKKVRIIWKEAGIDKVEALIEACEQNKICLLKGFGEKTQQTILENIVFLLEQEGRYFYAEVEPFIHILNEELKKSGFTFSLSGDARRLVETVELIKFLVAEEAPDKVFEFVDQIAFLEKVPKESSPFAWRGKARPLGIKVEIKVCAPAEFGSKLIIDSSGEGHLDKPLGDTGTLFYYFRRNKFATEDQAYASLGLPVFLPELREGFFEFDWFEKYSALAIEKERDLHHIAFPELISFKELKGALHNHSTYSDGENSIRQMAEKCIEMGLVYFGIADHSKSAQYANGMFEDKVFKQHKEIEDLNTQLGPFKIFKGIESDILPDGSLDYDDDILRTFDYVVASIHSGFKMDEKKATARLIKAIENPYTTILGHPSGRLLLRRKGYPIDHQKVIDACVANKVSIEINANPYRLDIDWRWVPYALEKGAIISINPDAHDTAGLYDMHYGILVARKGGLTKENCLNAMTAGEVEKFFKK